MKEFTEEFKKCYVEWQREYVNGNQNTVISMIDGSIKELDKTYYWQEIQVYNILKPIIDDWCNRYGSEVLDRYVWGINNAVDQLIPYQKAYNKFMNHMIEATLPGTLLVEDGSVDVDDLCEEGLAPGKVLIYRQGSKEPKLIENKIDIAKLHEITLSIELRIRVLAESLEENFIEINEGENI